MDLMTVRDIRELRGREDVRLGEAETWLAGGTWLFSAPQDHVRTLVDVTAAGWTPVSRHGHGVSIAATCTITQLVDYAAACDEPALGLVRPCAQALVMSEKIWPLATVGGNICLALPAGAMTSWAAAMDAHVVIWSPGGGERNEPVASFVRGVGRTGLCPGEVVRSIEIGATALTGRTAMRRMALSSMGRTSAMITARLDPGGECTMALTAATERPHVWRFAGLPSSTELTTALGQVRHWYDDPHGAPDWRRHVAGLLAHEVVEELG
jgi:CO/xanthine dehydrogenase FAD-binding subunit